MGAGPRGGDGDSSTWTPSGPVGRVGLQQCAVSWTDPVPLS